MDRGGNNGVGPAGRFLHICYCCPGAGLDDVVALLVEQFAFRNTMSTPVEQNDGEVLGLTGVFRSGTAFVYDFRGPRTSPAIEVQGWHDPPLEGTPTADPTAAGIQALGIAVADVEEAILRLEGAGCKVVGRGPSPFGQGWASVSDPSGVVLDLRPDPSLTGREARLAHIRIGCRDLTESIRWYEGIGFEQTAARHFDDGAFVGLDGAVSGDAVRLRLAEEPFEAVLVRWISPEGHGRHPGNANHAGLFRAALRVEDTRAAHTTMVDAGWAFDRAPLLVELHGTPVPDMWICFLSDPDGVPYEFVQRPASAFR